MEIDAFCGHVTGVLSILRRFSLNHATRKTKNRLSGIFFSVMVYEKN